MKVVTARKMREIDRISMEKFNIPGLILMENAGLCIVEQVEQVLSSLGGNRVVILSGKGNNGGDGFVVARHLSRRGKEVDVFATADSADYRGDAAVNYNILVNTGFDINHILAEKDLILLGESLKTGDVVVDALLGTGIEREVRGLLAEIIQMVNQSGVPVVAVDIPSGVNADTGEVLGVAARALITVTFALSKQGLYLYPGAAHAGQVIVGDIGIPDELMHDSEIRVNLVTQKMVSSFLPKRLEAGHKGTYGRVLIVAGSPGMTGAAALAGRAAIGGGAGLVYIGIAESLRPVLESKLIEVITLNLAETPDQYISPKAVSQIVEHMESCDVLAIGPGLPPVKETVELLEALLPRLTVPVVIDAGGISALAQNISILHNLNVPAVLTPHPGEMARLVQTGVSEVQSNRLGLVEEKSREWGAVVVLKGAYTITGCPEEGLFINSTGNTALATAGTGDLLTGLIASFIAQGLSVTKAAIAGAFVHGRVGDLASKELGNRGVPAGRFLDYFPSAFQSVIQG